MGFELSLLPLRYHFTSARVLQKKPLFFFRSMGSLAKVHCRLQSPHLSFNHCRPSFSKPIFSLSFRTSPSSSPFKFSSIRASSSPSSSSSAPLYETPKPSLFQTLTPLLKATCITITAAAALFFTRFHQKPVLASPTVTPTAEPISTDTNISLEDQEKTIEEHLIQYPNDVEALRSLMEVRIKSKKLQQAIEVIGRLIELEPKETEWSMLKAQIHSYSGDFELAKNEFEEILVKDPVRVEAFHGLVIAYSESGQKLKELEKRIEGAMEKCKKEKRNKDFRDFKLLIAQIRVIEGNHSEALKVYEGLVKEEPRDFRPYLCMGLIYSLLNKKDEAEKQFEKFTKLLPRNHPYREFFVDNMVATKLFAEKVAREGAGKS
ncbi:protein SLOW GREEN 1, chloroplastic-like [Durio zibethinus]|uniref:Protein SLOW GREEN 1, chloroplastic-like n=1 Tax=Durio zibethinus TaxID=66656 RepID=A0A6P6ARR3_DURZI|nr:protein SLOW GREEN 1, chloroplastic-like [Durio zibethinus]